jgi:hypothetical protein
MSKFKPNGNQFRTRARRVVMIMGMFHNHTLNYAPAHCHQVKTDYRPQYRPQYARYVTRP